MLGFGLVVLAAVVVGALAWLYTPDKPRAALEAEYAQPPSVFLDIAGLRLHVRDTGPRDAPGGDLPARFWLKPARPGTIGRGTWSGITGSSATTCQGLD